MTRIAAATLIVCSIVAIGVMAARRDRPASATPGVSNVLLVADRDPQIPAEALDILRNATRRNSADTSVPAGSVLVIDASALGAIAPADLHARLNAGIPIVALNVPLAALEEASGYSATLASRENATAGGQGSAIAPGAIDPPLYSFVWVSVPDANGVWYSGDGQKDFRSLKLFAADIRSWSLKAQGLTAAPDGSGAIIRLEDLSK